MQSAKITDPDGQTRNYAFDIFDGSIWIKVEGVSLPNPGRPYRFLASLSALENSARSAECRGLLGAHEILWANPERAAKLLSRPYVHGQYTRGAHT